MQRLQVTCVSRLIGQLTGSYEEAVKRKPLFFCVKTTLQVKIFNLLSLYCTASLTQM